MRMSVRSVMSLICHTNVSARVLRSHKSFDLEIALGNKGLTRGLALVVGMGCHNR